MIRGTIGDLSDSLGSKVISYNCINNEKISCQRKGYFMWSFLKLELCVFCNVSI